MPINGSGRFIGPGQPIRNGLIGWYDNRYKEPDLDTGNNWVDISGNNKDLTANSSPGWSYGYYFEMDGSDDYFRTTSLGSIGANYSIEWWGDGDADTSVDYVFDWRSSSGTNYVLKEYNSFDTNMNNVARINWSNGYQNWHHTAVTDTNSATALYINGESVATGTSALWSSNELTIGARYSNSSPWNGKIGCVRIYDRALSATEIRHNFMCDAGKFGITIEGTS